LVGKPDRKTCLEDLGIGGRIKLKQILRKQEGGIDRIAWLRIGTGHGLL
jgi:hypothetical protein